MNWLNIYIIGYGTLREEQHGSVGSVCSSGESGNNPCTSPVVSNERSASISATRFGEDLYSWMAKQDTKEDYDNKFKDLVKLHILLRNLKLSFFY